ncbi:MAG: pyridoxamine 5'-phosphate oxidase family protein [Nitrososphaeria archaeon]|nr:pyridoxamine 5'-phosphate oxidase family protein [Nitrososphaeria archaeon]NDB52180.1 pyridoxamine 5'-phosphate oxidase family protein [Nitrosopumilaceae archaeon]NDB89574.1 pyridoxamine 5'-phosphate oxidase family protein [Nitrososphaerota archaeon]NDF36087.1 pyridoxamine 5'-phosphate oxidase family protein [Nitrosopumilaceae archaeon]
MQLLGRLEIKSPQKIAEFLNSEHVGRIASLDKDGFPQIIPMNFAFVNNAIYMHSHTRGEKLDNIKNNQKVGFEVDKELEFLPSYFTSPTDASQADTFYISVVIKGDGIIVNDKEEKTMALNALMEKYQPEGQYEKLTQDMHVVDEVAIIKVIPKTIKGKYKIGQHMDKESRINLARKILQKNSPTARKTIQAMGFDIIQNDVRMVDEPSW